ncbi:MAG: ADP-ribosylglycohydrolase family protein, partial [Lentisphaeraceae bacterium]|nr:ADP-ribosylglycohydrolase family protein [Lentisphaeraceae bacterium]
MEQTANKILASFYGLAFGDALGSKVNCITVNEIQDHYGKYYNALNFDESDDLYHVGDDTQLALYTALSMKTASISMKPIEELSKFLCLWFLDPKNNRPTSQQNLRAIERLNKGIHWSSATNTSINSSSALIRNIPIAFWFHSLSKIQTEKRWRITQEATVLTHASAESIVSSCLLNELIALLLNDCPLKDLYKRLQDTCFEQTTLWSSNIGNSLWELPGFTSSAEYLEAGFDKCLGKFQGVLTLVNDDQTDYDPCELIGEGWDAEDALAVGLYCFLLNPDDPESVVQRSAFSNGPSDIL